ncbi:serine hydrolase [Escherichia coli]
MLLGFIVESVTGQPLDRYVEESIHRPLGLTHTALVPLLKGFTQHIAATEFERQYPRSARSISRISAPPLSGVRCTMKKPFIRWAAFPGHAGLLSNTGEIALMQTMLNGGLWRMCSCSVRETGARCSPPALRKMPLLASAGA